MNRRQFFTNSATALLGLAVGGWITPLAAKRKANAKSYSIVILGDTHFDADPDTVYHSDYKEDSKAHRAEFVRNAKMWSDRCPRLVKQAASMISGDTRMVFQMGDLVQGDCGNGQVHRKMLDDAVNMLKSSFGKTPFVTVVGNHDIRGTQAKDTYHSYMPGRMSAELGKTIEKTTFGFTIGKDAYLFVDFNNPDDEEIERFLESTKDARYTFVISHGPIIPDDTANCRWFFHGGASEKETLKRRHFRKLFAQRNAICLCGHIHTTEMADWWGDEGRITQMIMSSVWTSDSQATYEVMSEGAEQYGELRKKVKKMPNGKPVVDESALFDEYRPGLREYSRSKAAGSYKMHVSEKGVTIEFHAGDSPSISHTFILR